MRLGWMVSLAAAALVAGCVYDPYTGTYVPCCANYGYPYPYPPPVYAYPPYGPYPPGYGGPPPNGGPPPGAMAQPAVGESLAQRFAMANVAHDGRLTQAQAAVGGMPVVTNNFNAIDIDHKGYVTLAEIQAWMAQQAGYRR